MVASDDRAKARRLIGPAHAEQDTECRFWPISRRYEQVTDLAGETGRDRPANSPLSAAAVLDIMSNGRHGCINLGRHEPLGSMTR